MWGWQSSMVLEGKQSSKVEVTMKREYLGAGSEAKLASKRRNNRCQGS